MTLVALLRFLVAVIVGRGVVEFRTVSRELSSVVLVRVCTSELDGVCSLGGSLRVGNGGLLRMLLVAIAVAWFLAVNVRMFVFILSHSITFPLPVKWMPLLVEGFLPRSSASTIRTCGKK